jgi:malate synthase
MEVPFMRAYALALSRPATARAPAMGGMSALIPIKNDPEANEKALAGIRHDKTRDANDGFDGGWVAHPGLVAIAMEEFVKVLGDKPNQFEKQVEGKFGPEQWLDFRPTTRSPKPACATTSTSASTTSAPGWPATAACPSTT